MGFFWFQVFSSSATNENESIITIKRLVFQSSNVISVTMLCSASLILILLRKTFKSHSVSLFGKLFRLIYFIANIFMKSSLVWNKENFKQKRLAKYFQNVSAPHHRRSAANHSRHTVDTATTWFRSGVGNLFGEGNHATYIVLIVFPWETYNIFQHLM